MEKKEQIKNIINYDIDYKWDTVNISGVKKRELR